MTEEKNNKPENLSELAKIFKANEDFVQVPKIGDIVKGNIISANKKEVLVDVNGMLTGLVRGRELYNEVEEFSNLEPGQEVEATVLDLENERGQLELSFRFAGHQKAWESLEKHLTEGTIIKVKILDANKGGLMISLNHVSGFLPVSQLNPEHYPRVQGGDKGKILEKLKSYTGQTFEVKVINIDFEKENLIVSEKAAWEETQKDILNKYKVGDKVEGSITAVTGFGIFVSFGEGNKLEGLIHISELAWQRIENPNELFKVGEKVQAEIINIENSKIFLSIKRLNKDPWEDINSKYKVNDIVKGKILGIKPYGLFVELDKDIHGLAHISEIAEEKNLKAENIAKVGDELEFKILNIEAEKHRLGLTLSDDELAKLEETENKAKKPKPTETAEKKVETKESSIDTPEEKTQTEETTEK